MKLIIITFLVSISCIQKTLGHGHMYHPLPWHATNKCSPEGSPKHCRYRLEIPLPDDRCFDDEEDENRACSFSANRNAWFTNNTYIPGKATLEPEDMYDKWSKGKKLKGPFSAPGSAPIFGEGCGVNGGNPNGCIGEDNLFGTCCGGCGTGKCGCGGYVGGKSALEHYKEGLFDNAPITKWNLGQPAEVYWTSGMKHRGGYAYRLCKVNDGKVWEVTEECFQNGHLNFYGDTTWIYWKPFPKNFNSENWTAQPMKKTTIGTTPAGSEWAKVNLSKKPQKGDSWAIKDLVEIPEYLEPGHYILSFRWDSLRTPQVWSSCANIEIV